jgi:hypothetical protein
MWVVPVEKIDVPFVEEVVTFTRIRAPLIGVRSWKEVSDHACQGGYRRICNGMSIATSCFILMLYTNSQLIHLDKNIMNVAYITCFVSH